MRIVNPKAIYWLNHDNDYQIARAAKICYASEKIENPKEFIENKWALGHKSIFRHGTRYFAIPLDIFYNGVSVRISTDPFCTIVVSDKYAFVSTNEQHYRERIYLQEFNNFLVSEYQLMTLAKEDYGTVASVLRRTIEVTTQISTSRELNRVSPNNICEQSTRYCNFTQSKFDGEVSICQPHWLDVTTNWYDKKETKHDTIIIKYRKEDDKLLIHDDVENAEMLYEDRWPITVTGIPNKDGSALLYNCDMARNYIINAIETCKLYNDLIKSGFKPQDARGILPLDTATKCVYTYSLLEWKHILDLRYYEVTGPAHPNAKIAANLIRQALNDSQDYIKFPD